MKLYLFVISAPLAIEMFSQMSRKKKDETKASQNE